MDENKTPIYAAIIGFCMTFIVYQVIFNREGAGFLTWVMAFVVSSAVGAGAFFAAQKLT